ncbi:MAG: sigma-70 family RNA polymerase sigma factor [Oricola sp.]
MARGDTDDELLRAAADGSERAYGLLVSRHLDRVRRVARGYTGSAADADDIAQEVFLSVWRNAGRWRAGEARFSTWLYRVTANRCIDHMRRARFRSWIGLDRIEALVASDDDPERELAGRGELALAARAVAALPDRQRMAILLSVSAGLANPAIAETMGVSTGAVEQLLVRARRVLRENLSEPRRAEE